MDLFLIRHAQSANNAKPESQRVEDPGLTEIGDRQAEALARWLPELGLTRLITSPFRRTLLTTRPAAQSTGLVPSVRVDLHEQGGCYRGYIPGQIEGRPGMNRAEIEEEFAGWQFDDPIGADGWWRSRPHESWQDANQRATRLLQRTLREFADSEERVAYIMHADFKSLFIQAFHPEGVTDVPRNTSVTHVHVTAEEVRLVRYNQTEHLNADLVTW